MKHDKTPRHTSSAKHPGARPYEHYELYGSHAGLPGVLHRRRTGASGMNDIKNIADVHVITDTTDTVKNRTEIHSHSGQHHHQLAAAVRGLADRLVSDLRGRMSAADIFSTHGRTPTQRYQQFSNNTRTAGSMPAALVHARIPAQDRMPSRSANTVPTNTSARITAGSVGSVGPAVDADLFSPTPVHQPHHCLPFPDNREGRQFVAHSAHAAQCRHARTTHAGSRSGSRTDSTANGQQHHSTRPSRSVRPAYSTRIRAADSDHNDNGNGNGTEDHDLPRQQDLLDGHVPCSESTAPSGGPIADASRDTISRAARAQALQATLQQRGDIWRGQSHAAHDSPIRPDNAIKTGFASLDALLANGGWPIGAVTEIHSDHEGCAGLQIALPALARLSQGTDQDVEKWAVWIAPPHIPYAPALSAAGINLERMLLVHQRSDERAGATTSTSRQSTTDRRGEMVWAAEQALRSGTASIVLAWFDRISAGEMRRLQLAAEAGQTTALIFRPEKTAGESSPAALRLRVRSHGTVATPVAQSATHSDRENDVRVRINSDTQTPAGKLEVEVLRQRGAWSHGKTDLIVH